MKLKTKITLVAVPIIIGAGTYFAINTRPGVHLMLDVLSEIGSPAEVQTSAAEGPLVLTANISPIEKIQLPTEIEQPSGIKHRNGAVYISTDQTEIFKLGEDFKSASAPTSLLGGPLLFKQGSLEGIEIVEDQLFAIGEFGSMPTWIEGESANWRRQDNAELPADIAAMEFSGISQTPSGQVATSEEQNDIVNLSDGSISSLKFDVHLKENRDLSDLAFSGIAFDSGKFYILTETYTSIIVADASTLQVEYVFGIEPCAAADLSYHDGKVYVVIDHNYNEPVQPVHVYDIELAISALEAAQP